MNGAMICCSGGLDSVTCAFYAKKKLGYSSLKIIFFNYGQRNLVGERKASRKCSRLLGAEFIEIKIPELGKMSSSLLNSRNKVRLELNRGLRDTRKEGDRWYVPGRNLVFLSYSLSLAESLEIKEGEKFDIFVGFKNEGKEPFPDATISFVKQINKLSKTSTKSNYKILAPLIKMDKEDIVLLGKKLGVPLEETFSCYVGPRKHCGKCLACRLRKEGFYWANEPDKTNYSMK